MKILWGCLLKKEDLSSWKRIPNFYGTWQNPCFWIDASKWNRSRSKTTSPGEGGGGFPKMVTNGDIVVGMGVFKWWRHHSIFSTLLFFTVTNGDMDGRGVQKLPFLRWSLFWTALYQLLILYHTMSWMLKCWTYIWEKYLLCRKSISSWAKISN